MTPGALLITASWLIGIWLLSKARNDLPWQEKGRAPHTLQGYRGDKTKDITQKWSTLHVVVIFLIATLVTLVAGVLLEENGDGIATHIGLSGVIFGSTFLAASTSLPEFSISLASVKAGAYNLAFSDIFGENAFLPALFLLAALLSGEVVLPQARNTDIYLAG